VGNHPQMERIALVVHPTRPVSEAQATLERWAGEHGLPVFQPPRVGSWDRQVAPPEELARGDLIVALGGDGTALAALRASAPFDAPVLGVACGSVGALTAVEADRLGGALERVASGDWSERRIPALAIEPDGGPGEWAINDFVVRRRLAAQVIADVSVDDELYVRLAGDGLIVASPLGSSAYSMAAGGPLLTSDTPAVVCTPMAMHGGHAPPLVVPASSTLQVRIHPTFAGFDIEIDGDVQPLEALDYRLSLHDAKVTLVSFGEPGRGIAGLRERRLISDSPRALLFHERAARAR
jgi:NAD+ kinase